MDIEDETHVVVGIGLSDDGIETFFRLLDQFRAERRFSIVCVYDAKVISPSKWTDDLATSSSLTMTVLRNKTALAPGLLYVCPQSQKVQVRGGVVLLDAIPEAQAHPSIIDDFFHSLAKDQGQRAVAIKLSGEGADGKLGLQSILDHGGVAFSQTSTPDQFDSMQILSGQDKAPRVITTADVSSEIQRHFPSFDCAGTSKLQLLLLQKIEDAIPHIANILKEVTDHSLHD